MLAADEIGGIESSKSTQKSVEPKSGKLSKFQKLAKSKKPSKSGNSPNFSIKKPGPNFLTFDTRKAFNHLRLALTEAPTL